MATANAAVRLEKIIVHFGLFRFVLEIGRDIEPPMSKRSIYSHDYETLLEMLRKARNDAGVSQIDLAKRLSITQSAVSKFERGDRRLDVVQLRDWCKALKVSFSDFMTQFDRKV